MNKARLRLKGCASALRPYSISVGILVVLYIIICARSLSDALKLANSSLLEIGQLVKGEIAPNDYVTITGIIDYDLGYVETENDTPIAVIFPVFDEITGEIIFVRFTQDEMLTKEGAERIMLSGKTATPTEELTQMIKRDLREIEAAGFKTTSSLYIDDVLEPGQLDRLILSVSGLLLVLLACGIVLAMPRIVFSPEPLTFSSSVAAGGYGQVQVTGKLEQIDTKKDTLGTTKQRRHFAKANANVDITKTNVIMIHVHSVISNRFVGIKYYQTETDWLAKIPPHQVMKLEPGKLYTFDVRWAVRFVYKDLKDKEAVLVLSFENNSEQLLFINTLRNTGFSIQSLGYANSI